MKTSTYHSTAQDSERSAKQAKRISRIKNTPKVCGGVACIRETRIPVWVLEQARRLGIPDEEILADYPSINRDDLSAAWGYVDSHREQIDEQIAGNQD